MLLEQINNAVSVFSVCPLSQADDVRDTPSAKIIRELRLLGYTNITGYDPVAKKEFERYYSDLAISYANSYDELIRQADVLVITTAWPEFANIKQITQKPVVDCRYML